MTAISPMWFNVPEARTHLLERGFVYTLRPKLRYNHKKVGTDTLMYDGFGDRGTVEYSLAKFIVKDTELEQYVPWSGFDSLEEWLAKAKESRFLYLVQIVNLLCPEGGDNK